MKRIRSLGDSRIGLAIFDASEDIMKILREKYNLSERSMVYVLFNAITPGANHKTYSDIHRSVTHNMDTIVTLGELLNSKNTDFNKLFQIIDAGIKRKEELVGNKSDEVKKNDWFRKY